MQHPEQRQSNCSALPEYTTVRKLESALKGDVAAEDDEEGEDEEVTTPSPKATEKATKKATKPVEVEEDEDEEEAAPEKTAKELFQECKKLGIKS